MDMKFGMCLYLFITVMSYGCGARREGVVELEEKFGALHLVKIVHGGREFFLKGYVVVEDGRFRVEVSNEIGMPLFSVVWNGSRLSMNSPVEAQLRKKLPFRPMEIAVDMWRIMSQWSINDIELLKKSLAGGVKILDEDVISERKEGECLLKTVYGGGRKIVQISYCGCSRSGKGVILCAREINYRNLLKDYQIKVIQKVLK